MLNVIEFLSFSTTTRDIDAVVLCYEKYNSSLSLLLAHQTLANIWR